MTKKYNISGSATATDISVATTPLICNRLYPSYMAVIDRKLHENSKGKYDNNVMRCAYSKLCKVPWSEMNCDKYD